jgi:hypothetical protein
MPLGLYTRCIVAASAFGDVAASDAAAQTEELSVASISLRRDLDVALFDRATSFASSH